MTQHDPRLQPPTSISLVSPHYDGQAAGMGNVLSTILNGKWVIAVFTALSVFATIYFIYGVSVAKYRSTAVVMLEIQRGNVVDLQSVVSGLSGERTSINSEVEVLRSRGLMSKVVDRLNLVSDPEFNSALQEPDLASSLREKIDSVLSGSGDTQPTSQKIPLDRQNSVINTLLKKTAARNIPQSLVFEVTTETNDPVKSALISDTIVELYIENQIQVKIEATQQATTWLSGRVSELQVQLENAESRLASFSASTDLVSVAAMQGLERQLKDLRGRIAGLHATDTAQRSRLAELRNARSGVQKAASKDDANLGQMIAGAEKDPKTAAKYSDRFDHSLSRAVLETRRSKLQLNALEASEVELEGQIRQQSQDLITLQHLTREAEANRQLYEYFLGRLKETSAQQGIQQADSRILSDAVVPTQASSPRKSLLLSMATLFGLALGTGFVLLRETRNTCFRSAQDLEEYCGLSVLGQVPTIPKQGREQLLSFLADHPASDGAEALRNLRTSTFLSNVDNPPQVIMLTSPMPGEGKTTVSLAFAQTLSGMGKKVLLIEGDVRRRMFRHYFAGLPSAGLISQLLGTSTLDNAICNVAGFTPDILIAEQVITNAADLFSSDRFRDTIAELRNRYDAIVIDTPPVLAVPDARIIAQHADAVLLNIKWNSTSKLQIDETLRLFRCGNMKITGLILNQICIKGMKRYGYGGRYGTYATYETDGLVA